MNIEMRECAQDGYIELGEGADKELTQDIALAITTSWNITPAQYEHPLAILIGGFQGAGKTTTVKALNSDLQLPLVSSDEIRYQLLQRNIGKSDKEFIPQVFAVRNNLISFLRQERASFILDQIITPIRICLIENLLKENDQASPYTILKILLTAPIETLRERVSIRLPVPNNYQGTLEEFEATVLKYGGFEFSRFQRVFNTERLHPNEVANEIKQMIKPFVG